MNCTLNIDDVFMTVSGIGAADTYSLAATLAPKLASATPSLSATQTASAIGAGGNSASPSTTTPQSSIEITLGGAPSVDVVYAKPAPASTNQIAWTTSPTDDISRQMEGNLKDRSKSGDLSSLFSGLGSQLLNGYATSQGDFHQSVVIYQPQYSNAGTNAGTTEVSSNALQAAKSIQNNIALKIYTASGKTVDIAITFGGDGSSVKDSLSIDLHSSAALSIAEQVAIANLSKGFDAALQGIGQDSTKVDVSGLVNFDTKVLFSVDLNVRATPQLNTLQSLDLHVDASGRSFTLQSQAGKVSVKVDLSTSAPLGSAAQQQTTVKHYLDQFDAASRRGHGDPTLLGQFKDAFAQLHSAYPVAQQSSRALLASRLSSEDKSALSGLADFQASMSGDFSNGPLHGFVTEAGHLDYQVSQSTQTLGADKNSGLSVAQTQTAALNSIFAKSRGGVLDTDAGDYDSYQINDNSSTTTFFEYAGDKLKSASITNMLSQSEKYQKLEDHKTVAESITPNSSYTVEDISAKL